MADRISMSLTPGQHSPADPRVQAKLTGLVPAGYKLDVVINPAGKRVARLAPDSQPRVKARRDAPRSKTRKLTSKKPPYVTSLDRPAYNLASKRAMMKSILG